MQHGGQGKTQISFFFKTTQSTQVDVLIKLYMYKELNTYKDTLGEQDVFNLNTKILFY